MDVREMFVCMYVYVCMYACEMLLPEVLVVYLCNACEKKTHWVDWGELLGRRLYTHLYVCVCVFVDVCVCHAFT